MARNLENADDWLFRSMKDYSSLHMYELQHPTRCLECLSSSNIMIATQQGNGVSELMELRLPAKLTADGPDKGLCSDRDFKVLAGGFHSNHITQLAHSPENSSLVCAETGSSAISVWRLGKEDTDLVTKIHTIDPTEQSPTKDPHQSSQVAVNNTMCVYGPNIKELSLADIDIGKNIRRYELTTLETSPIVSDINFTDGENTCVVCTHEGALFQMDSRAPAVPAPIYQSSSAGRLWSACCRAGNVYMLSSWGEIMELDLKNARIEKRVWTTGLKNTSPQHVQLKKSPNVGGLVSVSGFDSNVHVYDLTSGGGRSLSPLFTHIGHWAEADDGGDVRPRVLAHTWHPSVPRLLLSAASDGSLHAWQYAKDSCLNM